MPKYKARDIAWPLFLAVSVMETVQWLIIFGTFFPVRGLRNVFARLDRFLLQWVYYRGVVVTKRRLLGEALWQDHDFQIGISPPPGTKGAVGISTPPPIPCLLCGGLVGEGARLTFVHETCAAVHKVPALH